MNTTASEIVLRMVDKYYHSDWNGFSATCTEIYTRITIEGDREFFDSVETMERVYNAIRAWIVNRGEMQAEYFLVLFHTLGYFEDLEFEEFPQEEEENLSVAMEYKEPKVFAAAAA